MLFTHTHPPKKKKNSTSQPGGDWKPLKPSRKPLAPAVGCCSESHPFAVDEGEEPDPKRKAQCQEDSRDVLVKHLWMEGFPKRHQMFWFCLQALSGWFLVACFFGFI